MDERTYEENKCRVTNSAEIVSIFSRMIEHMVKRSMTSISK